MASDNPGSVATDGAPFTTEGLTYDNPAFPPLEWDTGRWGVQTWLDRTAGRTLKDTHFGRAPVESGVHPALFEDPLLRQVYLMDIALFIAAERTSYEAVAGMVRLAPDEISQMQLGTQVLDECRHYEVFCRRMADFGVSPEKRQALVKQYTTPAMRSFYDLILEQVDKGDFYGAAAAQNLTLEGMAYPVYRYEIKYWSRFDPSLSAIIRGAFADEVHHVGYGEAVNRNALKRLGPSHRRRIEDLMRHFNQLMTEVFEQVIKHYIGLYQECANQYTELTGDIEIFPGRRMADVSEEEQTRLLLKEIADEHHARLERIGLA